MSAHHAADVAKERRLPGRMPRFPLRDMSVGDMYFAVGATSIQIHAMAGHLKPMKFRARAAVVNGVPGAYVWRIA